LTKVTPLITPEIKYLHHERNRFVIAICHDHQSQEEFIPVNDELPDGDENNCRFDERAERT
jgi:hypothetical protein